jgi:hypothetical protein
MRRIRVPNINLINSEKTFLDSDYTTGTTLTVVSNLGFAANDYAVSGEPGEEKTESSLVASISNSDTITVSVAYNFDHNKGTTLYRSEWNQIVLERRLIGAASWTSLATFNIQWDKKDSLYVDTSGNDSYEYRFKFYNSATSNSSEYSPSITGAGFPRKSVGRMIINIRKKVRDPRRDRFTDSDIIMLLGDGQADIETLIPELWFLRVDTYEESNGIAATASTNKYSLATYTDLNFLSKIKYVYVNGTTQMWELDPKNDIEFNQYDYAISNPNLDDNTAIFKLLPPNSSSDQGYFKVYPTVKTDGVGTFYPVYYRHFDVLNDVSDETELPFPELLEDYVAWKIHDLLGNTEEAIKYKTYYFGPNTKDRTDALMGIALLEAHNAKRNKVLGYGRKLWNYKGPRARNNYFPNTTRSRDYIRENYMP